MRGRAQAPSAPIGDATAGLQGLYAGIRSYLHEAFMLDPGDNLPNDASLLEAGVLDSTGILEVVAHLEEAYGFEVLDDEIVPENFDSIDALCRYVGRKTAA